ncbi:MAG: glycosyltransferase family 39 protein [Candidatus Micrarchaeota archaeon]|nr:glycosyltransferase family 39 protein [Candidatus Micrarchaeota archaeon]MDE1847921.1 glycosyltransferase family 39 protein [Candidatus Micrarchaeota archaeon]MDE1864833.1 glycosyltransferase family 39 protein [Candidatus Micrarchaeota archaeon]
MTRRKAKVRAPSRHRAAKRQNSNLYTVLLICLVAFAIAYSIAFVGGPSFFGDDSVYLQLANSVTQGNFVQSPFIFSVRVLQVYPIAFFFELFGVNLITSSAWDILSFVGLIVVAFYLGKELHSSLAGILSATMMAFFPLIVMLSATVSDDIPMAFITALAMLALLLAQKRNSKKWYFATGALLVASPLVTPEGLIIIIVAVAYLLIELLANKIKIDGTTLFLPYGFVSAIILLLLFNFVNSGNPLVTFTTNTHFYSAVGGQNTIPTTNVDSMFYPNVMFPYNLVNIFTSAIHNLQFNPIQLWGQIYVMNSNNVGFFFYALVVASAYLIIKREHKAYFVLFWFAASFLYLEFGPMHVSLSPLQYLLSYRLQRFLTLIAPPAVVAIGIAMAAAAQHGSRIKRGIGMAIVPLALAFLVITAIPINMMWYHVVYAERYDQLAIAGYLNSLPGTTQVYYTGAFANLYSYMHYANPERFSVYDGISNCSQIPGGSYIIIPKYNRIFSLNYTPDPLPYCPNWQLVLSPKITPNVSDFISSEATPFRANLYYIPKTHNSSQSNPTGGNAVSSIPVAGGSINATKVQQPTSNQFNYFNLTGAGYRNATTGALGFVVVNNVSSVSVAVNKTSAYPDENFSVTVYFHGTFKWYKNNATSYYLSSPIINVHYFGVELANQSGKLLDQNNGPWSGYVSQPGEPEQLLVDGQQNTILPIRWVLQPTKQDAGKTIKLCGGYYAAYQNTTLQGGWGDLFDNLSRSQTHVVNSSAISIPSSNCANLQVPGQ